MKSINGKKVIVANIVILILPVMLFIFKLLGLFLKGTRVFPLIFISVSFIAFIGYVWALNILIFVKRSAMISSYFKVKEKYFVLRYAYNDGTEYFSFINKGFSKYKFKREENTSLGGLLFDITAVKKDLNVYVINNDSINQQAFYSVVDSVRSNSTKVNAVVFVTEQLNDSLRFLFEEKQDLVYPICIELSNKRAYFPEDIIRYKNTPISLINLLFFILFGLNKIKVNNTSKRSLKKMIKSMKSTNISIEQDENFGTLYYKDDKYLLVIPFEVNERDHRHLSLTLRNYLFYQFPKVKEIPLEKKQEIESNITNYLIHQGYYFEYID